MEAPTMNFLDPNARPPGGRARRRKRVLWITALAGALLAWQGIAGGGRLPPADNFDPISPLALITRVGRIVIGAEPLFADRDRTNILVLGIGGAGHDGPLLTDTMILVSSKSSTKQVALLSIPRDLVADIPGIGVKKINSAYALAEADKPGTGGEVARETVAGAFGVPIQHWILIDFTGFEKLVDDLGGVTVDVERSFSDSQYPVAENEYTTVSFSAGPELMDGATALRYARSRHGSNNEGSDFARARRQQKLLLAIVERSLSRDTVTNPVRISAALRTLSSHIATDLSVRDLVGLAERARETDLSAIRHMVIDDRPGGELRSSLTPDGSFVLEPSDGTGKILRTVAENMFSDAPAVIAAAPASARVEVQNGTATPGLAAASARRLREAGFTVVSWSNAARLDYRKTVIYDYSGGAHPEELRRIAAFFDAETAATIPNWLPPSGSSSLQKSAAIDFLVILGTPSL